MRADARRNHALLIGAAREAFTEHGAEAPLDDVARRAGVGAGTLYRHFPTREALLAGVYRADLESLSEQADELAASLSPEEALIAWLRLELDYVRHRRGLSAAVKAMLGLDSPTMTDCKNLMRGSLDRLLGPAKETGVVRPEVEAADVLRLIHGVALATESVPDDAHRLLDYVIDGLRPQQPR
jgi:AcrR family transcriptional regulator